MQAPPPQYKCSGNPGEVLAEKWTVRSMYFVFSCCVQGPTGPAEGDGGSDSEPARGQEPHCPAAGTSEFLSCTPAQLCLL